MSSHDAAAASLMDRMGDIDKQHRWMTMQQKEVESRIAFATQEKRELTELRNAMNAEEKQLKKDLEELTEEQRLIEVQQMNATNRVRHTQVEEPLLLAHVTKELEAATAAANSWKSRFEELATLRKSWEEGGSVVAAMVKELGEKQRRGTEMREEREEMRQQLSLGAEELRKLKALRNLSTNNGAFPLSGGAAEMLGGLSKGTPPSASPLTIDDVSTMQEIREAMEKEQAQWSQTASGHQRQVTALQREVEGLVSRANELQRWLSAMDASKEDIAGRRGLLRRCIECDRCPRCLSISSGPEKALHLNR